MLAHAPAVRRNGEEAYNGGMEITVKLPDDLAEHRNPGREALEALVVEGYRSGAFSHYQASQLLGLSRLAFEGFLKERNIYEHAYSEEDLKQDEETWRTLEGKGSSRR
jgi:predicted HTH domain antitoxin